MTMAMNKMETVYTAALKSNDARHCDAPYGYLSDCESMLGTSPVSPLPQQDRNSEACALQHQAVQKPTTILPPQQQYQQQQQQQSSSQIQIDPAVSFTYVSLKTLIGCSEILGHTVEDRTSIASQQDSKLVSRLQANSTVQLRGPSQRPLFTVAPLDVLVTRDEKTGRNQFHIIEINGTGIAGLSNMPDTIVGTVMRSISELPAQLAQVANPVILVASSGQESNPPVSRTMHEKVLYIEALKRGFEALGRPVHVTNMMRLQQDPNSMPASGPVVVLGYMKQFRQHFVLTPEGDLQLLGRQVHAAINDRFVLNIMHQFEHRVNMHGFMGYNVGFLAGADKGVAYALYNSFFGPEGQSASTRHPTMAPRINFARAHTKEELVQQVQLWLKSQQRPVVIKPQGTGCGHGIEFFFGAEPAEEVQKKVDGAIAMVARNYALECGGLPFTVCEFLDTAAISDAAAKSFDGISEQAPEPHPMTGHKFELRIVVYREGSELKAYPSIAKVAREAFDPDHPDKSSLINNITTSAKKTGQSGSEFMLPLSCNRTLQLLGIHEDELTDLCGAATEFMRYVVDQVEDQPTMFGLPASSQ